MVYSIGAWGAIYYIAQNCGGVKLWWIDHWEFWQGKLWQMAIA